jgi:hypothetical protein
MNLAVLICKYSYSAMQSLSRRLKVNVTCICPTFNFKTKKYEFGEAMTTEILMHTTNHKGYSTKNEFWQVFNETSVKD